ncbi:glycosyltransferase family 4 protein [Candidatus Berkelbacteria bacterium]|nr:glycosyltransferase family 4 protein [Candidatus Berkelbacteria bacterium]
MKVAVIIPPYATLPVEGQGGTERVAFGFIQELNKRGIDTTTIGAGSSNVPGEFVSLQDKAISDLEIDPTFSEGSRALRIEASYIARVANYLDKHQSEFDAVFNHMRAGFLLLPLAKYLKPPIITTLHLPIFPQLATALEDYAHPNIVTVSKSQQEPAKNVNFLGFVHNAIDLSEFTFNQDPEEFVLFVGAMGEHKAPHLAIEAAKRAGVPIVLAGDKKREPYFSEQISPLIDNQTVIYRGEVSGKEKADLFGKAKAILMTSQIQETFGLVMIEALASGTPVVSLRIGASDEVIVNGKTGYVVDDVNQMADSILKLEKIDRRYCREYAEKHFSFQRLTDNYLDLLKKIN